jgi:hypothetical protein
LQNSFLPWQKETKLAKQKLFTSIFVVRCVLCTCTYWYSFKSWLNWFLKPDEVCTYAQGVEFDP